MRKAVLAAAVTTGVAAAAVTRRPRPAKAPPRARAPKVVVPAQRSGLALIVDDVDGLEVAEQEARDAQVLSALDALVSR